MLQESALNDVAVHTLIENMGRPGLGTGVMDSGAILFNQYGRLYRVYGKGFLKARLRPETHPE